MEDSAKTIIVPVGERTIRGAEGGTTTSTLIAKPRLLAAVRMGWLAAFAICVALLILGMPGLYVRYSHLAASVTWVHTMLGVTPEGYALWMGFLDLAYAITLSGAALFLALRRSEDWMVMITALTLVTNGAGIAGANAILTFRISDWYFFAGLVFSIAEICLFLTLFMLPDGQFVPRAMRYVMVLVVLWCIANSVATHSAPNWSVDSPFELGFLGLGLAAQIYRYRQARPAVRQQLKWIIFGIAMILAVGLFRLLVVLLWPPEINIPLAIYAVFGEPILSVFPVVFTVLALVIAILRYRLWDIDLVINRSIVGSAITAILGLVFIGGVLFIQTIAQTVTGGQQGTLAVAVATVVVGVLFQPTRARVRRLVDRRLYGWKVDLRQVRDAARQEGRSDPGDMKDVTTRRFGSYEVYELVGRGGMGEVYRGKHTGLDREVAIKVLPSTLAADADSRTRFEREARTVAGLKHPNIVQVFDFGQADGTPYMAMEYIPGVELSAYLRQRGRLLLSETQVIVGDIAAALDYAHALGLVHRDVKPSNVMLHDCSNGQRRAVLMDFGIVRMVGDESGLTHSGLVGTLDYIAPEQILTARAVDHRADIYALGIIVFQMLTGQTPFGSGGPGQLLFAHLQRPAPDPCLLVPDLPSSAARAILRALAKAPADRFNSAGEFARALSA